MTKRIFWNFAYASLENFSIAESKPNLKSNYMYFAFSYDSSMNDKAYYIRKLEANYSRFDAKIQNRNPVKIYDSKTICEIFVSLFNGWFNDSLIFWKRSFPTNIIYEIKLSEDELTEIMSRHFCIFLKSTWY